MSFAIYSVGDSAFLEQVLISVAMVSGSGSITAIASIGLLIGVLVMGFSSVMEGGKAIPFEQLLVGWILYAICFYPTTTVVIEDNLTGSVRPVANVPLGVAVSGFVVSSIGYKITDLFEQGYGFIAPSVTTSYFAEPLELITKLRSNARNPAIMAAMDQAASAGKGDLRKSWDNYIRECTVTAIDLEAKSLNSLLEEKMPDALSFESRLFGTRLYINDTVGRDYTCSEGYSQLVAVSNDAIKSPMVDEVFKTLVIENHKEVYESAADKFDSSLNMLGVISDDSYAYMIAAVLEPIYEDAALGRYQDVQDVGSAIMLNQAITQRNTQWAAEQSMFMSVVRPMQTFFEGFVYAVTPMLAILLVMGRFGMGLAGKYLQTIFWIQLWMPILSIINLYICTAASNQMSSLLMRGELTSMYNLNSVDQVLQTWIAAGGMLAAATPVISFFLISGSAYAFTSIAGRLGGADHVDEKITSPDTMKNGAVMQSQPMLGHNTYSGSQLSGTEGLVGNMSLGQSLGESVSSSSAQQQQASEAFSKQLSRTFGDTSSATTSASQQQALGRTVASMESSGAKAIQAAAKAIQQEHGLSTAETEQVMGKMALTAGGVVSASRQHGNGEPGDENGKGGRSGGKAAGTINLGGSGSTETQSSKNETSTAGNKQTFGDNISFSNEDGASFKNELAERFSNTNDSTWSKGLTDSQATALSQSAQQSVAATESYTAVDQAARSVGASSNLNYKDLGATINQKPEAQDMLNNAMSYASSDTRSKANNLEEQFKSVYKMDSKTARTAASVAALAESKDVNEVKSAVAVANAATGSSLNTNANPDYNSGIPKVGSSPTLREEVISNVGNGGSGAAGVRSEADSQTATSPSERMIPTGSSIVENEYFDKKAGVEKQAQQHDKNISAEMLPSAQRHLKNVANAGLDEAAKTWGAADSALDVVSKQASQKGGALLDGIAAFTESLSGSERSGMDFLKNGFSEAVDKGGEAISNYIDEHGAQLTEQMTNGMQSKYNLTDAQAEVFAANFNHNGVDKEQAEAKLMAQYENKEDAANMIKALKHASHDVGQAGAYLQPIQNINAIEKNITDSRSPALSITEGLR